jgi:hypothetical protein
MALDQISLASYRPIVVEPPPQPPAQVEMAVNLVHQVIEMEQNLDDRIERAQNRLSAMIRNNTIIARVGAVVIGLLALGSTGLGIANGIMNENTASRVVTSLVLVIAGAGGIAGSIRLWQRT